MRTSTTTAVAESRQRATSRRRAVGLIALPFALVAACATDKSAQLGRVAKDWCLTIRASQVLPVYPLVEDLRPGDVFLTTTPVGEEVALFESRGFLPLDNLLTRLGAANVFDALRAHYGKDVGVENQVFPRQVAWAHVPHAKFPSYTFEVARSGGIDLALPIQGVPVGLAYLRASRCVGSVALTKAHTLGVPIDAIDPLIDQWAAGRTAMLAPYGSFPHDPEARPVYVRVVTRVYTVGKVAVHLADTSASGGELAAGSAPPLALPSTGADGRTAAERQQEVVEKLNAPLHVKFGGRVRIASATERSIALDEEFERPVVVGYLAYDRLILPDGTLGAPVSTLARVTGRSTLVPQLVNFNSAAYLTAWFTKDEDRRAPLLRAWVQREYPDTELGRFLGEAGFEDARLRAIRDLGIR
jgi:hypothetical protein